MKIDWAPCKDNNKADGTFIKDIRLRMSQTYSRKPALKAANLGLELDEIQQMEWVKCAMDAEYFIRNYYRITTIDRGFILFEPFDYQVELIQAFQDNRWNVVCQCRQSGKTTVVAAFLLWYALFHGDKEIAILANKEKQAKEIMDRMQKALSDLPFFLQQGLTKYGATEMNFENESKVYVYATSPDAIRGRSCAVVYLDEFAFVDGDEEFWESVYPTMASATTSRCIITSTPKGQRGMFHNIWVNAEEDAKGESNGFHRTLVTWDQVPNYANDPEWEPSTRKRLGDSRFKQEMECVWGETKILLNDPESSIMFETGIEQAYKLMANPTHVVYRHTNTVNGKQYVGITKRSMQERWKEHVYSAFRENSVNAFHCAIRKYGVNAFEHEILYVDDLRDYSVLEKFEREYIVESNCLAPNGYNMTEGGGGTLGFKFSDDQKERLSSTHRESYQNGRVPPMAGRTHSAETKEHWSSVRSGVVQEHTRSLTDQDITNILCSYYLECPVLEYGQVEQNGLVLTKQKAFARSVCSGYGVCDVTILNIILGRTQTASEIGALMGIDFEPMASSEQLSDGDVCEIMDMYYDPEMSLEMSFGDVLPSGYVTDRQYVFSRTIAARYGIHPDMVMKLILGKTKRVRALVGDAIAFEGRHKLRRNHAN
ncbi:coil containing protein [Vibrio phage 1.244.A._10N.261.54.C3]|nr:coil containing protein [Vibrio phage 1.244.A._10N.261.54.C3]AUR98630.1 coil containing protein [Vibrio phage 1.255.O._10N.286.45.F1]